MGCDVCFVTKLGKLSFEQMTAAHQKFTILEPELYTLSLLLNTSCKHAMKSYLQNSEGLTKNASSYNFTAIIGMSAGLGNKAIQHKQTDNLELAHAPASFSVSLELAHNLTKSV